MIQRVGFHCDVENIRENKEDKKGGESIAGASQQLQEPQRGLAGLSGDCMANQHAAVMRHPPAHFHHPMNPSRRL